MLPMTLAIGCLVLAAITAVRLLQEVRTGRPSWRRVTNLGLVTLGGLIIGLSVWL